MSNKPTKINQSDLKFYPSERLDDTDEGGGMPLGTPIKGTANEIFSPISSVARVNGDFDSVLLYGGIQRPDNEPLIGSFVAITKPPADPAVSYLLFAGNFGELRKNSIKRIENYASATIESPMTLLSNPSKGSKIIQAYQRVGEKLPQVGDVYCLRQDKQGYAKVEQYIQLVKVEASERKFTGADGRDFTRMVVKLEISQALNHEFVGIDYPVEGYSNAATKIRETHVADAAQYYGIKPLAAAVRAGMSTIKVSSMMEKIVPTAQAENALIDVPASQFGAMVFDGSFGKCTISTNTNLSQGTYHLLPFLPNSLEMGAISDQNGKLMLDGQAIGTVNYALGTINIDMPISRHVSGISFRPATSATPFVDSYRIDIDLARRSYNHVITLPQIGVGSLVVSYMAQGKWYDLKDNGAGTLVGTASEHGSGTVNYKTGTVSLTTGQLPDAGSSIIFNVGNAAKLQRLEDTPKLYYHYQLAKELTDGAEIVLGDKSARYQAGKITGGLAGFYDTNSQVLSIEALMGKPTGEIRYYTAPEDNPKQSAIISAPSRNLQGQVVAKFADVVIQKGTIELAFAVNLAQVDDKDGQLSIANKGNLIVRLYDDGQGNLKDVSGTSVGTIDYQTATATFNPVLKVAVLEPGYKTETFSVRRRRILIGPKYETHSRQVYAGFTPKQVDAIMATDAQLSVTFFEDKPASPSVVSTESITTTDLAIHLKNSRNNLIIDDGSVVFSLNGDHYFDRNGGIYTSLDITTGHARRVGKIDYHTGQIIMHDWSAYQGAPNIFNLLSASIRIAFEVMDEVSFRTAVAPVRLASVQLRATLTDGTAITATADNDGHLNSEWITGRVDAKFGFVTASFGKMVSAEGKENEPWYKAEAVQNGQIWQPKQVIADSIVYNAVGVRHLPINSTAIKIDTVRLPSDGLIPIFRRGDTVLIGNRQTQTIGSAHSAGQTVQLDRQNLDRICVMDAKDKPVLATLWDYDLDAGTITWKTPLDLSGYELPLKVMHAIEEKNRVVEVDIDGTLSLMFPIKNSYEPSGTYVSSVLLGDDLAVRHSIPFTQSNWDNVWRDEPNGNQLLNRLNVKDYPIVLTDDGAITERWLIKFTSGSQFELYGETLGFVLKTDTLQNLAPINPATAKPYFTLDRRAFGGAQGQAPWQTQNVIRFNTTGTLLPFWVLRAVQPTPTRQQGDDGFTICLFGDTTENEV